MKITIATGLYPPEIGGPATYAAMLESELPKRGFDINIVPFGWVRHYPKIIRHVVFAWKLWRESKGASIIYALDPTSVGLPTLLVARLRRSTFLVRLGGDYAWEQGRIRFGITEMLDEYLEHMDSSPLPVRLLAKIQSFVVGRAKLVIVPSNYLKSVVEKWGIPSDKIRVIYSSLYPLSVNGSRDEIRSRLEYKYPTIISAGRLVPWKGFDVLIDVIDSLRNTFPDITLIIAGDGEDRVKLGKKAADLNLREHIKFIGSISKDTLGATIKAADVFVLNTAYEGLSHQLIEVMDIGTAIVTTKAGGNPELITDGVNGFLVDFNNVEQLTESITRVLNHPESRERMVQSARGFSKEFAKEKILEKIVAMLNEVHGKR